MNLDEALHRNAELGVQVQRFEQDLKVAQLTIEKLKVEVAYLRRMKLEHAQLDLTGGEMAPVATADHRGTDNVTSLDEQRRKRTRRTTVLAESRRRYEPSFRPRPVGGSIAPWSDGDISSTHPAMRSSLNGSCRCPRPVG